jgi:rubrerythrin
MDLSSGWSNHELALIPESRIEEIADILDQPELIGSDGFYKLVDQVKRTVYCCPSCGRMHVDDGGGNFTSFVQE